MSIQKFEGVISKNTQNLKRFNLKLSRNTMYSVPLKFQPFLRVAFILSFLSSQYFIGGSVQFFGDYIQLLFFFNN